MCQRARCHGSPAKRRAVPRLVGELLDASERPGIMSRMGPTHRKTLRRYEIVNQPRFLTFSCYRQLPLFQNDAIKEAFVKRLQMARSNLAFRLIAWVIMPEHVHLILVLKLPDPPMPKVLSAIKRRFAEQVLRRWKQLKAPILDRIRTPTGRYRFWQSGGGYDRNIRDEAELFEKIEYIHMNPVKRALVTCPTDWKWSSAQWYADQSDGLLEIDPW